MTLGKSREGYSDDGWRDGGKKHFFSKSHGHCETAALPRPSGPGHPPPTTTTTPWEGPPPARPPLRPGTRLAPALGAAKGDSPRPRERGGRAAILPPPPPPSPTIQPDAKTRHAQTTTPRLDKAKAGRRRERVCVRAAAANMSNPRHAVGRGRPAGCSPPHHCCCRASIK